MTGAVKKAAGFQKTPVSDADLWTRYKETGDTHTRNELVLRYSHLVEIIARKMSRAFYGKAQLEDIISNGMVALIKVIEGYDPTREIKFETYASPRIRGSVIDYIRSQDWVPRSVRDKASQIEGAYTKLRGVLPREPTASDIAALLNLEQEEVETIMNESHIFQLISFEEILSDQLQTDDKENEDNLSPHALLLHKELGTVLARAIDKLTDKQRTVISLFYYEGLKVKEISEVMGISSPRVCQLHSTALMNLKADLKQYAED